MKKNLVNEIYAAVKKEVEKRKANYDSFKALQKEGKFTNCKPMKIANHVTKKSIITLLQCKEKNDWSEMFKTDLYIKYGAEYTRLLEIVASIQSEN